MLISCPLAASLQQLCAAMLGSCDSETTSGPNDQIVSGHNRQMIMPSMAEPSCCSRQPGC